MGKVTNKLMDALVSCMMAGLIILWVLGFWKLLELMLHV